MGVNGQPVGLPLALDPREPSVPLPGKWQFWAEGMVPPYRPLGQVDVSAPTASSGCRPSATGT